MDLLKAQLGRLSQQFAALTASQRMLSVALIAIMGMTLFWWTRYAGEAEMSPLLNQSFSQADIAQITARLAAKNINYTVTGDRIMVPADRNIEVLADLGFAHLLPSKTEAGFDDIVGKMSPWDPESKDNQLWLVAKQRTLESVIGDFPGVVSATVVLSPTDERHFGEGGDVVPTAMVSIGTGNDGGEMNPRQLATAAADMVAGANAGMQRSKVAVTINGMTYPVDDNTDDAGGGMPGDEILGQMRDRENHYRDQIHNELGFIRGLMLSVRVDLNTKRTHTDAVVFDPKNVVHQLASDKTSNTSTQGGGAGSEPGAAANTGANDSLTVDSGGGAGGGTSATNDTEDSAFENHVSQTNTTVDQGPGDGPAVSASVRVPRSYFVATCKALAKGQEPDEKQVDDFIASEISRIRDEVKNCTGIKDDAAVSVNWYVDDMTMIPGGATQPTASASAVSSVLKGHFKEIGVGGLALVSLFMMMMMVRKSAPVPIPVPAAAEKGPPPLLKGDSPLVGEVGESGQSFDGMELDEESLKTQQMVEQVSTMVSDNPDGAATLVKRWLNRG